jgi:hypothetical protein
MKTQTEHHASSREPSFVNRDAWLPRQLGKREAPGRFFSTDRRSIVGWALHQSTIAASFPAEARFRHAFAASRLKSKDPAAPAVKREAEEDWGR